MSGSRADPGLDTKDAVVVGTPVVDHERCKGCGLCMEFCPFGHLRMDEELNLAGHHPAEVETAEQGATADTGTAAARERFAHNFAYWCLRCRYCELMCPDAAIRVSGDVGGLEGTGQYGDRGDE